MADDRIDLIPQVKVAAETLVETCSGICAYDPYFLSQRTFLEVNNPSGNPLVE